MSVCVCQCVYVSVCVCVRASVRMCLSVAASHISETSHVIAVTFDTVTASMHDALIILTLTFIPF